MFKMVLWATDVVFYVSKVRQFLGVGKGMDDDLEAQMKRIAKDYGVDMQHGVFDG